MQMEKFLRRAQQFVGTKGDVDTVTVIQQRPPVAWAAGIGAFVAVAAILNLLGLGNTIVVGGLGGMALAAALMAFTSTYYLAGVGSEVHMIKLATWTGQPETLEKTLPRPLDAEVSKGMINRSVVVDGEKYILSRVFESELSELTDATA